MEIRFCDRCSESIPESDFESGRAVSVEGRHLHVACALGRTLSLSGPRGWLVFLLALYAAGVATYLLVASLSREEQPDRVNPAVESRIQEASDASRRAAIGALEPQIQDALGRVTSQSEAALGRIGEETKTRLDQIATHVDRVDQQTAQDVVLLKKRLELAELEVNRLNQWIRTVAERAEKQAPAPTPSAPEPLPTPPTKDDAKPEPAAPTPPDADHDREVQRWIDRLRDANVQIRFSATLELGRLKDVKAVPPLLDVLDKDKDYYVRLGAATALGDIGSANAVPSLIEALDDKDNLVRNAANAALKSLTHEMPGGGPDFPFEGGMSTTERRKVMRQWRDWWKENEQGLRNLLGQ